MSMDSHSYLIFGFNVGKAWLTHEIYEKHESMICGAQAEPVWIFYDDNECFVGIPLARDRDGNGIENKELDLKEEWSNLTITLIHTLIAKGLRECTPGDPKFHTFHIWS